MATVVLESLSKIFPEQSGRNVSAVDGLNLAVEPGDFMVLVGPSGCGKSTTLRLIAGLEQATGGRLLIDGKDVTHVAPKDRDIAMVFQNYALYPHMTVYDNMAFGLKLRNTPRAEIDTRVREAAALLGLEGLLERRPKALSGGQRQRVALGRAIVRKPKVFLFDEPLSNLDAKMRVSTRAELSRLHARLGATMIYVTHDQVEAMTMGDRICVMHQGRIIQVDEPMALYDRPAHAFVAGFIGSPAMNLAKGRLERANDKVAFVAEGGGAAWRLELPAALAARLNAHVSSEIIFGVRPEHLQISTPGSANPPAGSFGTLPGRVELSEMMGADTLLHVTVGAAAWVARVPPTPRYQAGDTVSLGVPLERAHFFDAKSEQTLLV